MGWARGMRRLVICLALASAGLAALPAGAAVPRLPSCGAVGLLGYSDALDKTVYAGTNVGGLSGTVYDAARNVYYSLVDNEGDTPARVYTLRIPVANTGLGEPSVIGVTTLTRANGTPFTGRDFDGEGLTLAKNGDWLIASETEPSLRRFGRDGRLIAEFPVPERFRVAPAGQGVANATFEGASLSPSGDSLFIGVEAPLAPDGYTLLAQGRNRILRYVPDGASYRPAAQYFYQTDTLMAISDVLALSDSSLLVLERSFIPGYGNTIRVYQVSLVNAPDVTNVASLASSTARPLPKTLLVDLETCPDDGVPVRQPQPNRLLDNYEDLAWGRATLSGRTLLLISDDNFNPVQITRIVALSAPTKGTVGRR